METLWFFWVFHLEQFSFILFEYNANKTDVSFSLLLYSSPFFPIRFATQTKQSLFFSLIKKNILMFFLLQKITAKIICFRTNERKNSFIRFFSGRRNMQRRCKLQRAFVNYSSFRIVGWLFFSALNTKGDWNITDWNKKKNRFILSALFSTWNIIPIK